MPDQIALAFPKQVSIGHLHTQDPRSGALVHLGQAQGDVNVPRNAYLCLTVGNHPEIDLSCLAALPQTSIASLTVEHTADSPNIPESLLSAFHLRGLRHLSVEDLHVSHDFLDGIPSLSELEALSLVGCELSDGETEFLKRAPTIQQLSLTGNPLTDLALHNVAQVTSLVWLNIAHTKITDEGLLQLRGLQRLKELLFMGTAVGDAGLEHLLALSSLERLGHSGTNVTSDGLARFERARRQQSGHVGPRITVLWSGPGWYTAIAQTGADMVIDRVFAIDERDAKERASRSGLPEPRWLETAADWH